MITEAFLKAVGDFAVQWTLSGALVFFVVTAFVPESVPKPPAWAIALLCGPWTWTLILFGRTIWQEAEKEQRDRLNNALLLYENTAQFTHKNGQITTEEKWLISFLRSHPLTKTRAQQRKSNESRNQPVSH